MFTRRTARLEDLDYGRGIATSSLKEFVAELNPVDQEFVAEPAIQKIEKRGNTERQIDKPLFEESGGEERQIDKPLSEESGGEERRLRRGIAW